MFRPPQFLRRPLSFVEVVTPLSTIRKVLPYYNILTGEFRIMNENETYELDWWNWVLFVLIFYQPAILDFNWSILSFDSLVAISVSEFIAFFQWFIDLFDKKVIVNFDIIKIRMTYAVCMEFQG